MGELANTFALPAGPEDMPEGMDFWVNFYVDVEGAEPAAVAEFARSFEGAAVRWAGPTFTFAIPSRRAEEFREAAPEQDWCEDVRLDDHAYSKGEYFDPAQPVDRRFLFGFAG